MYVGCRGSIIVFAFSKSCLQLLIVIYLGFHGKLLTNILYFTLSCLPLILRNNLLIKNKLIDSYHELDNFHDQYSLIFSILFNEVINFIKSRIQRNKLTKARSS